MADELTRTELRPHSVDTDVLSVVVPVFNEREWIARSVSRLVEELDGSPWRSFQVIVVDDGSTDGTGDVIDEMSLRLPITVVHQDNRGRFAARMTGLTAATGDWVLLLDSRVLIEPGSLSFLGNAITGTALVWNAHVDVAVGGNAFARFWDAVTRIAWWRYFAEPRTLSYGIDEFDLYPKGTTCFFGPRDLIVRSAESVQSFYVDPRHRNDDTSFIRQIAREQRVWISPGFRCAYEGRSAPRKFLTHAFNRGVVFVDGHLRRESRFAPAIIAFYPLSLAVLCSALVRPWAPAALLASGGLVAGVVGMARRLPRAHIASLVCITPIFAVAYGAGMWKGLLLVRKVTRA